MCRVWLPEQAPEQAPLPKHAVVGVVYKAPLAHEPWRAGFPLIEAERVAVVTKRLVRGAGTTTKAVVV